MEARSQHPLGDAFNRFARTSSRAAGKPAAFVSAVTIIVIWAITGPIFHYNDSWQLVINTGTTIVTFLMVFLLQNTQNRESDAIHIKLDELIRSIHHAQNSILNAESLTDDELKRLLEHYESLAQAAKEKHELRRRTKTR